MDGKSVLEVLRDYDLYIPQQTSMKGQWIQTTCPFAPYYHTGGRDRNPSFGIMLNPDDYSTYNCFSCKQSGYFYLLIDTLARLRGNFFGDMESSNRILEIENSLQDGKERKHPVKIRDEAPPDPLNRVIYENMFNTIESSQLAIDYLTKRGVSSSTSKKLGLLYDSETYRIIFPIEDVKNDLYGFTGRAVLDEEFINNKKNPKVKNYFHVNKERFLLGENRIKPRKPTLVVEGLFGYARLSEVMQDEINVVAVMGSNLSKYQADTLIKSNTSVYLLFDNDDAGSIGIFGRGKHTGAVHLLYNYCPLFIPEWPEGKTDPDELTKEDIEYIFNSCDNFIMH